MAGVPFNATITPKDAFGNTTDDIGNLTSTDGQGLVSGRGWGELMTRVL